MYKSKRIGILGGGQLGRMLIQSAMDFDIYVKILDPDPQAPCKYLAHEFVCGDFKDFETVMAFAKDIDVLTIEIENVNIEALFQLQKEGLKVYPQPSVLSIIKDKRVQKAFFKEKGIPTADFVLTENKLDIASKIKDYPMVNKIGEGGYDGKGVQVLRSQADLAKAFDEPSLLEELVDFEKEIAVIVARNAKGEISTFPSVEMVFHPEANLVEYLFSPAKIAKELEQKAQNLAREVAEKFKIIGLLAVEMFLTKDGKLLVNEVAPRPHNSGHQTMRANITSQFEQHIRAISDMSLGDTSAFSHAAMVNILGRENHTGNAVYEGMDECLALKGVHPFLYGKSITKPFRKMGHVSIIDDSFDKLIEKVNFVKNTLTAKTEN